MARYPRAVAPNRVLDAVNMYAADIGAPALASANRVAVSHNMSRSAKTIANASSADGLARNVTVTGTQVGGANDTGMDVLVTGTNVLGQTITETIIPVNGSTVAGTKAFKTVTSAVQAAWVIGGTTADTLTIGFGNLVGLPAEVFRGVKPGSVRSYLRATLGGAAVAAPAFAWDADEPEKNTLDGSASTYDGTKHLIVELFR